jgi:hypothetical protein
VLLHGRIRVGVPCAVTGPAQESLGRLLTAAAGRGLLRIPVADAVGRILAANVGMTLSLIGQPEDNRDPELSHGVREAVLSSVLVEPDGEQPTRQNTAVTLRATLDQDPSGLTAGEAALLTELLDRLSRTR